VVALAARLRNTQGVSYDACMGMAVHLTDPRDLQFRTPLVPWPESLDRRWTVKSGSNFLAAARQFVKHTGFNDFMAKHRALYQTTESRLKELLDQQAHLEWFRDFFGEKPNAAFTVIPGMLNGGSCYGAHFRAAGGQEELFCMLGVWQTDSGGLPEFTSGMVGTVVHEFGHSYANPLIDRHWDELRAPAQILYKPVAQKMRSQAYGEPATLLRESLVRACGVRYARQYEGTKAASEAIRREKSRGFLWSQELSDLLGDYEAHRDRYPTLEAFAPRLVAFFHDYAKHFAATQAQQSGKQPKAVSVTPANGATDVSPGLTEIRVTFDCPMQDHSWSLCDDPSRCPKGDGSPHYDATRTTWIAPVKLEPHRTYEFSLNSASFDSFRSEEGVALEPVAVTFTTGGQ
jgi:hypothetical protein